VYGNICLFHSKKTDELISDVLKFLPKDLIKICIGYFYDTDNVNQLLDIDIKEYLS